MTVKRQKKLDWIFRIDEMYFEMQKSAVNKDDGKLALIECWRAYLKRSSAIFLSSRGVLRLRTSLLDASLKKGAIALSERSQRECFPPGLDVDLIFPEPEEENLQISDDGQDFYPTS